MDNGANPYAYNKDETPFQIAENAEVRALLLKKMKEATLFQRCLWKIREHLSDFDSVEVKNILPDHVWWEFFDVISEWKATIPKRRKFESIKTINHWFIAGDK